MAKAACACEGTIGDPNNELRAMLVLFASSLWGETVRI
jgi:hypothetical protein